MSTVLRERARALALARVEHGGHSDDLEILRFDLAGEVYAVELSWIGEVRPVTAFTFLPCAPPFVRGIINVHGRIVSLVDLSAMLELPDPGQEALSSVVILRAPDVELGLLVGAIRGITALPIESLQTSLPGLSPSRAEYLKGVAPDGMAVLDGAKILAASLGGAGREGESA